MSLLQVNHMTHYFGGLRAVYDYNLNIEPGVIHGLIGPNGAGKTTIFNLITGIYTPSEGEILLDGKSIKGMPPHLVAAAGLARTFQNLRLWRHMTVLEHIKLARYSKISYGLAGAFFNTPKRVKEENEITRISMDLLNLVGISHLADTVVTNLPYGAQRRVELARAMAIEPKVLFLDEPTAGMNPEEMLEMEKIIRQVMEQFNLAIFLIEHRMRLVMDLCDYIQTLVFGEVVAEGLPEEIRNNPIVIDAYLGKEVET
ncbi:MAG: ABC transporter ATP-binding protein [Chloroflexi bacterium]|nr:ABC transporter ATP-binding protein [Chloroflexota bacterium]